MTAKDRHDVRDVFTPTTPARLAFVERESINNKLVNALRTPGKQVVVYGYSGSGKTTLLENKLHQAYERHLTTRCVQALSFEQLVLDAFDQLEGFYESELTGIKKTSLSSSVSAQYAVIKAQVKAQSDSEEQRKKQRILPPQLTPQTLARLLGEAGCCWVLEDFHKMESAEKVAPQSARWRWAVGLPASWGTTAGGSGYGGQFSIDGGQAAQLRLHPGTRAGAPNATTNAHKKGELYMDSEGALFVCTDDRTPGPWKRFTTTPVT